MVVWNSMLLKIIIISLGVAKQHVRFIVNACKNCGTNLNEYCNRYRFQN
jgi:hypothetical protein